MAPAATGPDGPLVKGAGSVGGDGGGENGGRTGSLVGGAAVVLVVAGVEVVGALVGGPPPSTMVKGPRILFGSVSE